MMGQYCETDLSVGDRVLHVKDPDYVGTVMVVEDNRLSVMVQWDDCDGLDFAWANKVVKFHCREEFTTNTH